MLLRLNLILACFAISISAWATALEDYKAGDLLYHQGQYAQAVEKYQAAVQANPGMWEGQMGLGNALFHLGRSAEAVKAYDASLALHPDNPTLKAFADKIRPKPASETLAEFKPIPAPATSPASTFSTASPLSKSGGKAPGLFFSLYGGYDYALLGAMNDGIKGLQKAGEGIFGVPGTNSIGNGGIIGGLNIGYMLDKNNSISLDGCYLFAAPSSFNIDVSPGFSVGEKVTPSMMGGTLNYQLALFSGKGVKTNLSLGVGWYFLSVDYFRDYGSPDYDKGTYSSNTPGGTFSISEEIDLGGGLAIGITAKGRWANFSKVTASTMQSNNPGFLPPAPYALVLTDIDGDGSMDMLYDSEANVNGTTETYCPVDMSGVEGDLSFILYL